jgi:hypothetical protein
MKTLKEISDRFDIWVQEEALSASEKKRRKNRRIFGSDPSTDYKDEELEALGRGIIRAQQDPEEIEENECAGNPYRDEDGLYASSGDKGSYTLPKKPKKCRTKSGQGRRAAGSKKIDKDEFECGRLKRKDGTQVKCKDGELRENEVDLPDNIDTAYLKGLIEDAVNDAVKNALSKVQQQSGPSIQTCMKIINQLNKAEKGKLFPNKKK